MNRDIHSVIEYFITNTENNLLKWDKIQEYRLLDGGVYKCEIPITKNKKLSCRLFYNKDINDKDLTRIRINLDNKLTSRIIYNKSTIGITDYQVLIKVIKYKEGYRIDPFYDKRKEMFDAVNDMLDIIKNNRKLIKYRKDFLMVRHRIDTYSNYYEMLEVQDDLVDMLENMKKQLS